MVAVESTVLETSLQDNQIETPWMATQRLVTRETLCAYRNSDGGFAFFL
jgi:predicted HTH transcriptional regulator